MKLIHLVPLCGVALLAACDPKPSEPPLPAPTPTMEVIAQPTLTPGATVSPMPSPTATSVSPAVVAPAGTPDLGSGPMMTPDMGNREDKSLIAPPTSMPGSGSTSSDPAAR